jgi:hypothetical protein
MQGGTKYWGEEIPSKPIPDKQQDINIMMQETRQKLDTTLSSVEMQSAHVVHVPMSDKHGGLKRCNPRDTTLYSNMSLTLVTTW